ncbi:PASTA domain-containing protein [Solirubrobacter phytolaccae]|uniref:PASTA domain-containing protein n=1 Tax=Solirubrobacter phytolaccae TaxID=1404360 RepID=A0A9X3N5K0_9ACTN|nr:PASTA domain-containing protein [Solirubrobacter phytolaccae]MDA0178732.1 PASTA domain-containing protein [Solirubrobacter phytolaccae]
MRIALVLLVASLAALAAVLVFARTSDNEEATLPAATPTPAYTQLTRLVEQITRDEDGLVDQGIYVMSAGVGDGCAKIALANPTAPNVAYVQRQFPGTCVQREPAARPTTCTQTERPLAREGSIEVPDLRDLTLAEASRQAVTADLTYSADCLGAAATAPWTPVGPPDELARVVEQCPRPGELVRRGTEVALDAVVVLPGGFRHRISALDDGACRDGRNP